MKQKKVILADNSWIVHSIRDFNGSPVRRIGDEWMLVTAGSTEDDPGNWNTMTASWGHFGVLWGKDVAVMFIRPSRYTREFADTNQLFTLSFFDKSHRDALSFCGEKSGRDLDKAAETGLTPIVFGSGTAGGKITGAVGFKEASEIIVCKKIYTQDIIPDNFLDPDIGKVFYPKQDYHRMYVGEALALMTCK